jgi:hypothetical protein
MEKKKKTIQDITPGARRKAPSLVATIKKPILKQPPIAPLEHVSKKPSFSTRSNLNSKEQTRPMIVWVIAIISIGALVVAFSTLFTGATITVTPKSVPFSLNNNLFTAQKDGTSDLSYQVITLSGSKTLAVDTGGSKEVTSRAEGVVILYNALSEAPVNLLIDTRLESVKGIVYKTKKAVKIPGLKKVNGEVVPGSIEVDIYADVPGESGNDGMTDFVVVGFKGTAKESKVYGRSKTVLTGGVTGLVYEVPDDAYASSYESLRRSLNEDLQSKLHAEVPSRFFIVPSSIVYSTKSTPTEKYGKEQTINLLEEGELSAFIVDRERLSIKIAEEVLKGDEESYDVIVPQIEDLRFTIESNGDENSEKLSMRISGEGEIVWNIDKEKIAYDFRSTHRRQFEAIIGSYSVVSDASLMVQPFWRRTLPEKIEDIRVVNKRFD